MLRVGGISKSKGIVTVNIGNLSRRRSRVDMKTGKRKGLKMYKKTLILAVQTCIFNFFSMSSLKHFHHTSMRC